MADMEQTTGGVSRREAVGLTMGVLAGVLWGAIYLVPLWLPEYNPLFIASSRYATLILLVLPFLWMHAREFREYTRSDWLYVVRLGIFGNLFYYWFLTEGVKYAGAPLVGMLMMLIPILVAIVANLRGRRKGKSVPWLRLAPGLVCMAGGLVLANASEFEHVINSASGSTGSFAYGVAMGLCATLLWVWYPIRNADWLLAHPKRSPGAWIAAQCVVLAPIAVMVYLCLWKILTPDAPLLGPAPWRFVLVMMFSGFVCYALGNFLWNIMSQRLPEALSGQMIVFETIFAVIYAHIFRGAWPTWSLMAGMVLLFVGFFFSFRAFYAPGRKAAAGEAQNS